MSLNQQYKTNMLKEAYLDHLHPYHMDNPNFTPPSPYPLNLTLHAIDFSSAPLSKPQTLPK